MSDPSKKYFKAMLPYYLGSGTLSPWKSPLAVVDSLKYKIGSNLVSLRQFPSSILLTIYRTLSIPLYMGMSKSLKALFHVLKIQVDFERKH